MCIDSESSSYNIDHNYVGSYMNMSMVHNSARITQFAAVRTSVCIVQWQS